MLNEKKQVPIIGKDGKRYMVDERLEAFLNSAFLRLEKSVTSPISRDKFVADINIDLTGGGTIQYVKFENGNQFVLFYNGTPANTPPKIFKVSPIKKEV